MSFALDTNDLDAWMTDVYQNPYPDVMYRRITLPESGTLASLSIMTAQNITDGLIEGVAQLIIKNRMDNALIPHTKDKIFSLIHTVFESNFMPHDSSDDPLTNDNEPVNFLFYRHGLTIALLGT